LHLVGELERGSSVKGIIYDVAFFYGKLFLTQVHDEKSKKITIAIG
jgi:hypothetical protein